MQTVVIQTQALCVKNYYFFLVFSKQAGVNSIWLFWIKIRFTEFAWGPGTYEILSKSVNLAFWPFWLVQLHQAQKIIWIQKN